MLLVHHLLGEARRRLAVIDGKASIREAAMRLAEEGASLLVVCDGDGRAVGIITRTDIVREFGRCGGGAEDLQAQAVMSCPVQGCDEGQSLESLWATMARTTLRNLPVLDAAGRPRGVLHARDVARALVDEAVNEEALLRDYIMGVGYH